MKITAQKKVIIILIAVILLVALVVGLIHATTSYLPAPLRKWEEKQLANAMGEAPDGRPNDFEYYLGKYNGYYVVSTAKATTDLRQDTIGYYVFCFDSYTISVWKDGIRMGLNNAYEQGKISDKDLAKIHEYHLKTLSEPTQSQTVQDNNDGQLWISIGLIAVAYITGFFIGKYLIRPRRES